MAPMFSAFVLVARMAESAKLERLRRDARTSWAGLFIGQRLERIADKADEDCKKGRKAGPPNNIKG